MNMNEKQTLKEKIQFITSHMTRGDIQNLLQFYFETEETPEAIVINRGNSHVEGFMKLSRRIFKFEIIFLENNNKAILWIKLKHGRSVIEKKIQVEFKEQENEIMIYQANDKMYLFSVYF